MMSRAFGEGRRSMLPGLDMANHASNCHAASVIRASSDGMPLKPWGAELRAVREVLAGRQIFSCYSTSKDHMSLMQSYFSYGLVPDHDPDSVDITWQINSRENVPEGCHVQRIVQLVVPLKLLNCARTAAAVHSRSSNNNSSSVRVAIDWVSRQLQGYNGKFTTSDRLAERGESRAVVMAKKLIVYEKWVFNALLEQLKQMKGTAN